MEVALSEIRSEIDPDSHPLLMERVEIRNDREHIIDIARSSNTNSSSSHDHRPSRVDPLQPEDRPYLSTRAPTYLTALSSSNRVNSRNSSFLRRGDGDARRGRGPLNSGLWISVELVITVAQIIASIVVLSLSRHENPQTPLFAWVVGYASGCVATLPILYWRYRYRNRGTEQDSFQSHQDSSQSNPSPERASYAAFSIAQASEEESRRTGSSASRNSGVNLNSLVDHLKMALDCFFAVWFIVGNVWIFGGHSSPSDAPKLYRLCLVFLTFSCIGYAMPFILCATICCCFPCIISILGFQEDLSQTKGATPESINALPVYKFKLKTNSHDQEINSVVDGGVMAAGTEKERAIEGEDAVCCICLAKYAENDELRELPCCHFFHVECVDKWLKIYASCPLCKYEVGKSNGSSSPSVTNLSPHHSGRRHGHGSAEGIYGTTMF
ncbi:E3 ubiquitin-protein ligase At1g63170-like [Actinidia eriantha]|uniref:E3 ubiquitin-protein ligase At1g63170-like n=1 Tax=Actinidia eriantha TaxID=165200 RepID=UPI00258CD6BE|nr:E3 ubiquitin-protein ligase At1g63170-like [Actinidia eriantha]XP_057462907.1 E3 ubiquitin-protein ligase At1g63170-like [Actinidia eriantha]XP_057462908.1 E3 ubiquitin-protein ligase At1g63170-like [Actinidia eriantha]